MNVTMKFKELFQLNNQLQQFTDKTPCWYEFSRNKIRTKRLVDSEMEKLYQDRQVIVEQYGKKDEQDKFIVKMGKDGMGRPIEIYDFGADDKEANEKLEALHREQDEKELTLELFTPKPENIKKTLEMDLSAANMEYIVEYILVEPTTPE
jgi:hypothetical protein